MGDRVYAEFKIGGALKRSDIPKLQSILRNVAELPDDEKNMGYTDDYMPIEGEAIFFCGEDYNYGTIGSDNIDALVAMGLEVCSKCAAGYDTAATIQVFGGEEGWAEIACDADGPVATLSWLKARAAEGKTAALLIEELEYFSRPWPPITIVEG